MSNSRSSVNVSLHESKLENEEKIYNQTCLSMLFKLCHICLISHLNPILILVWTLYTTPQFNGSCVNHGGRRFNRCVNHALYA